MEYSPFSQQSPARVDFAAASRSSSFAAILGRIEDAVEEETMAIRTDTGFDLKASNIRKSRCLYEFSRAVKSVGDPASLAEHRDGISRLRDKLAVNEAALRAHLSAVGEVAALLQHAIRHSEADGTYCASEFGWSR